jgi:DNA repair exonuclease SbcCD ATPase subunit
MASTVLPETYSFPKVRKLDTLRGPEAADELGKAYEKLIGAGISDGAARLKRVDEFVRRLDYPTLERLADPEQSIAELADEKQRHTRRQHLIRNFAALLPLLITWIMLSWASLLYHSELIAHKDKATTPFLMLWQQHFGHSSLIPNFDEVALFDFLVLAVVLAYTVQVHRAENSAAKAQADLTGTLYSAMGALSIAVEQSVVKQPTSAEEWAKAAQKIINDAMAETEALSQAGRDAIEAASASLKGIHDEGRGFIKDFSVSIVDTLAAVRKDNEQFIERTANEARQTLQVLVDRQMNPLLTQLTTMLAEFSGHQATYRASVSGLADAVSEINASAKVLAGGVTTYQAAAAEIGSGMSRAAKAQEDFATLLNKTAQSLDRASLAMNTATKTLQTDLRDKLQEFVHDVTATSADVKDVQRELKSTANALNRSTAALTKITTELDRVASSMHGGTSQIDRVRQPWKGIFFR